MQKMNINSVFSPPELTNPPAQPIPDDRILLSTRLVALSFTIVSLLVFGLLYLFPANTDSLFAWTIRPDMSAMFIGAAYFSGFYLFLFAVFARHWHQVHLSFLPLGAFVSFQAIATYSHLDRFHQGHIVFYLWIGLYTILPLIVPLVWLDNRKTDPTTAESSKVLLPPVSRWVSLSLGVVTILLALSLLVAPDLIISVWPWKLTPLTAGVIGGCFAFAGTMLVCKGFERRWSAVRQSYQSQMLWSVLILIASLRAWSDFDQTRPMTWFFIGMVILLMVSSLVTYLKLERQSRTRQ